MSLLRLITFRQQETVVPFDTDAQAFITAAAITDATQQSAINQLVLDLKAYSLWAKMTAIYPLVGGTSSAHSYNLKDPTTFQLLYNAPAVHNANGVSFTAISQWINTQVIPNTHLSLNSIHVSAYTRINLISGGTALGVLSATAPATGILLTPRTGTTPNRYTGRLNSGSSMSIGLAVTDSLGFHCLSRVASNQAQQYKNGSNGGLAISTIPSTRLATVPILLGCASSDSFPSAPTAYGGNQNYAFFSIGSGLTDAEAANFYTAVQTFQTTLGRQV